MPPTQRDLCHSSVHLHIRRWRKLRVIFCKESSGAIPACAFSVQVHVKYLITYSYKVGTCIAFATGAAGNHFAHVSAFCSLLGSVLKAVKTKAQAGYGWVIVIHFTWLQALLQCLTWRNLTIVSGRRCYPSNTKTFGGNPRSKATSLESVPEFT